MSLDRLTIAYQAAQALAAGLGNLGAASALACRRAVYTVSAVLAPRITTGADVALIGRTLVVAVATLSNGVAPEAPAPAPWPASPRRPARPRAGGFGRALAGCINAAGPKVFRLLARVAATVSDHIATVATDLQPVVGVETTRSASSTAIAWALYGDPARARELVARNAVACSIFMPTKLQVLAPKG